MQASDGTTSSSGRRSQIVSTVYPLQLSSMKRFSRCMVALVLIFSPWNKLDESCDRPTFPIQVRFISFSPPFYSRRSGFQACSATYYGQIRTKTSPAGQRTIEAYRLPSVQMSCRVFYRSTTWILFAGHIRCVSRRPSFPRSCVWRICADGTCTRLYLFVGFYRSIYLAWILT